MGMRFRWRGWRAKYPVAARALTWTTTGLAAVLVLFALLMPNSSAGFRPGALPGRAAHNLCGLPGGRDQGAGQFETAGAGDNARDFRR